MKKQDISAPERPGVPSAPPRHRAPVRARRGVHGVDGDRRQARRRACTRRSAGAAAPRAAAIRFDIRRRPARRRRTRLRSRHRADGLATPTSRFATCRRRASSGLFTPQQALEQLLMGTGVTAVFTDTGVDARHCARSEFVAVTGRAPGGRVAEVRRAAARHPADDRGHSASGHRGSRARRRLSEALRNVPGITLQAGEGGGASNTAGDMFNMRGFNAANSLFVDGVRDDGLISRDVFNLEQVEVFMGPTGSDVGRGTAAGYVNMQTKMPHVGSDHAAAIGYGSGEQARLTVDFNWALPPGQASGWLSKSAASPERPLAGRRRAGRDEVDAREQGRRAVARARPRHADARHCSARRSCARTTCPTTAFLARRGGRAAGADDRARQRPGRLRATTTAASATTTTRPRRTATRRGSSTTSSRTLTLRNQTRYNKTHREAVITAIQNVAAFNPATNLVTLARQGNERENTIVSNQTSLVGPVRDRRACGTPPASASSTRSRSSSRRRSPVSARGRRSTSSSPIRTIRSPASRPPARGAFSEGSTDTVALYAFDTVELGPQVAGQRRPALGALRHDVPGGRRGGPHDDRPRARPTAWSAARPGCCSGSTPRGNVYVVVRHGGDAAGHGELHAERAGEQSEQPERRAAEVHQLRGRQQVGLRRRPPLAERRVFRTENENVIFTVDATAVPPIYNQDDGQLVNGVDGRRDGPHHRSLGGAREHRLPRFASCSRRTPSTTATA